MAHKYTGLTFFGSWYTTVYPMERKAQTEHNQLFGKKISEISFQEIKENMEAYNLKYAIAVTPELKSKLESSGLFIKEKEFPHYTVYMFANYTSSWLQSEIPLNYKLEELSDRWATKTASAMVFVSQDVKAEALKYYNADAKRCFSKAS